MRNPEEVELIRRSQNGDTAAFDALFERHKRRIYNYTYSLTRNQDDASDVAQEAFVRAYRSIRSFRGESSFATWLA